MPRIDHVALYCTDLEATKDFYCRWFGLRANDGYHNPDTGLRTYFLASQDPEDTVRLEIMTRPGIETPVPAQALGWNHLAFSVGGKDAVDALARELSEAGLRVVNGPRTTGDGYYEAVVLDPEGNSVEIVA